jgi:thiol:disulfide interchange protein DsbD
MAGETDAQQAAATLTQKDNDKPLLEQQGLADKVAKGELSGLLLLGVLFLGGLLTNLTPCVFPMIPITIRILGKRSGGAAFVPSLLYALGIVVTYSSLGIIVAMTGGVFGSLLSNVWVSVAFAVLFGLLGISMLGFGNFGWLQNIGNSLDSSKSSTFGAFLMGAGAGLVGAPCTGPILGALIAFAAGRGEQSFMLFFVYSCGFALPYLFLGMLAGKVTKMRAPQWLQVSTKLLFAAAMFGLVFYFIRIPLYETLQRLKDSWTPLTAGLALITVPFWIAVYVNKKAAMNKLFTILPAFLMGVTLFSLSQMLTVTGSEAVAGKTELTWYHDEGEALKVAEQMNKPLLIDFWAEWCEACKKMDATTFTDERVRRELADKWVLLKFDMTQGNDRDNAVAEKYKVYGLPVIGMTRVGVSADKLVKLNGYVAPEFLLERLKEFQGGGMQSQK